MICPFLSINLFRYQKFSGKQKGSFTKLFVSVLWDKKFRQKHDLPPLSYAWKFSLKKNFWNTKVFSNEVFWYSETKTFLPPQKSWYLPPSNLWNYFPYQNFPERQIGSLVKFFRSCELKKYWTKPWSFPPPLLENFRKQHSVETQKFSPTNITSTVRQKLFNGV